MPILNTAHIRHKKGFTLIELLVVISIIAILSVTGVVVFTNAQKNARDAGRKTDVEAIAKAYESNYAASGKYIPIKAADFAANAIPQDPNTNKGAFFNYLASDGSGFKVCTSLEANPNNACNTAAANCICTSSSQSTISSSATADLSSTQTQIGIGGSSPAPSCDPNGTLTSGLIGHWKFDEGSGTSTANSNGGSNASLLNTPWNPSSINTAFKYALDFNGNSSVNLGNLTSFASGFTFSAWVRFSSSNFNNSQTIFNNNQLLLRKDNSGEANKISSFLWINNNPEPRISWGTAPITGTFYHVVDTYDGTNNKLYINGNNVASQQKSGPFNSANSATIGNGGSGGPFYGTIDEVTIYNKGLTSSEVSTLYNSGQGCIPN